MRSRDVDPSRFSAVHESQRNTIDIALPPGSGPTLQWPGKRLAVEVPTPRARLLECYAPGSTVEPAPPTLPPPSDGRMLLAGDNLHGLAWLLGQGLEGQVRLIYLDPPYASGRAYTSRVRLRGEATTVLGTQVQYRDQRQEAAYLQFMADRLLLMRELLAPDGTLWLHCDYRSQSRLQLLMEEIFGADCYLNTIAWRSQTARGAKVYARYFPRSTHYIHIFARSGDARPVWHPPRREILMSRAEVAARYMEDERGFFRTSHPGAYSFERLVELHAAGRLYAPYGGEVIVDQEARRVYGSKGGKIGVKYYVEQRGRNRFVVSRAVDNLWEDIPGLGTIPSEDVNYPTQKTEGLLRRIIETATDPGDLVLDPFVGSGTTVAVAEGTGRRWIGCDDNWRSLRTTALRGARKEGAYRILGLNAASHPATQTHPQPARATLAVEQREGEVWIEVQGFHSPAVAQQATAAQVPLPEDWRAQVQAVLIDPAYDGQAFRPATIDAPGGKETLVGKVHTIPWGATHPERPIAVLLIDILGDEHLFLVR